MIWRPVIKVSLFSLSLKTNQERKLMRLVVNDLAINHTDSKAAEPRTQFKA